MKDPFYVKIIIYKDQKINKESEEKIPAASERISKF
jgi:hypothetical protein